MKLKKINVGDKWATAVESSAIDRELFKVYKSGLPTMIDIFDKFVKKNNLKQVDIGDFGGAIGAVTDYINEKSKVKVIKNVTCIDSNDDLLKQNKSCNKKILSDLIEYSGKNIYDIALMRYVLNYNSKDDQLQILNNVRESLKKDGIFINYWCGVSNKAHQNKFQTLFATEQINKKFFRPSAHWTTWKENLELFEKAGFKIKIAKKFSVPIKNLYKVRYELNDEENNAVLMYLGKYKFISYVIFSAYKN
jgi:hypothetical protein